MNAQGEMKNVKSEKTSNDFKNLKQL